MKWLKDAARSLAGTTAHKGGAIAQVVIEGQTICFAACHLDAKKAKVRFEQAAMMRRAMRHIDCDSKVWMGDFNTRIGEAHHSCCPWGEMSLLLAHDQPDALRELVLGRDDAEILAPKSEFEEMMIGFSPTFHKRLSREGM